MLRALAVRMYHSVFIHTLLFYIIILTSFLGGPILGITSCAWMRVHTRTPQKDKQTNNNNWCPKKMYASLDCLKYTPGSDCSNDAFAAY